MSKVWRAEALQWTVNMAPIRQGAVNKRVSPATSTPSFPPRHQAVLFSLSSSLSILIPLLSPPSTSSIPFFPPFLS